MTSLLRLGLFFLIVLPSFGCWGDDTLGGRGSSFLTIGLGSGFGVGHTAATRDADGVVTLNLGGVALGEPTVARFRLQVGWYSRVEISGVDMVSETTDLWELRPFLPTVHSETYLDLQFTPNAVGPASVELIIHSNATNGEEQRCHVIGYGCEDAYCDGINEI